MNSNAKNDLAVVGNARVALGHPALHFDGASYGVDGATELDDASIAGALDDAAVMHRDLWGQ
jgi:hypothetical protein